MEKCGFCSKKYPVSILRSMVQIIDRKAYLVHVCPACQPIVHNNPNYYDLMDPNK